MLFMRHLAMMARLLAGTCLFTSAVSYASENSKEIETHAELRRLFAETAQKLDDLDEQMARDLEETFLNHPERSQRLSAAISLAAYYRDNYPRLSQQFLASAKTLQDPFQDSEVVDATIRFFNIDHTQLTASSELIQELSKIINHPQLPWKVLKRSLELMMDLHLQADDSQAFLEAFRHYKSKLPRFTLSDRYLHEAAGRLQESGQESAYIKTLEILASRYPLSPAAKWAFDQLLSYSKPDSSSSYHFTLNQLRRIHLNTVVEAGSSIKILEALQYPVKDGYRHRASLLKPFDKIQFLLRLREYDAAINLCQQMAGDLEDNDIRIEAELWLAHITGKTGQFAEAAKRFEELYQSHEDHFDHFFLESHAQNLMRSQQFTDAASKFELLRSKHDHYRLRWYTFWNYKKSLQLEKANKLLTGRYSLFNSHRIDRNERSLWSRRMGLGIPFGVHQLDLNSRQYSGPRKYYYQALSRAKSNADLDRAQKYQVRTLALQSSTDEQLTQLLGAPNIPKAVEPAMQLSSKRLPSHRKMFASLDPVFTDSQSSTELVAPPGIPPQVELIYQKEVFAIAQSLEIDPLLIYSLMRAESGFNPVAMSNVGARGIMQLMPYTAIKLSEVVKDKHFELDRLADPIYSILYGSTYFKMLNQTFSGNIVVAIAAYNAGPQVTAQWLKACADCDIVDFVERIPYRETRNYVKKVLSYYENYKRSLDNNVAFQDLPDLPEVKDETIAEVF